MYNCEVLFVQLTAKSKKKELKKIFKRFNFENPMTYENIKVNKRVYDGGWTLRNNNRRQFAIIMTRYTNKNVHINVLLHEKRHVEDHILHMCGVDDNEAAAYLAGYLGEKLLTN